MDKSIGDSTVLKFAVMGPTGSGKSTFIDLFLNGIHAVRYPKPKTLDIQTARYVDYWGRAAILIDTPGFDDSQEGVTHTDILEKILAFLESGGKGKPRLDGIIYMHRISDQHVGIISREDLRIFQSLCGENLCNVRIVTTSWMWVREEEGHRRQDVLARGAFKVLLDAGAQMRRHDNTAPTVHQIMSELFPRSPFYNPYYSPGENITPGSLATMQIRELQKKQAQQLAGLYWDMEEPQKMPPFSWRTALAQEYEVPGKKVAAADAQKRKVIAMDISRDSTRIASGGSDNTVRISSLTTGLPLFPPLQHDNAVIGLKFSFSGDLIATATHNPDSVRIYDSQTGALLMDLQVKVQGWPTTSLAWSLDGSRLFAASPGKITCLNTSLSLHTEWAIPNGDDHASITTNGRFIACSAGDSVSFWDVDSHNKVGPTLNHPNPVCSISLSAEGRYLSCGHGSETSIHDLKDILPECYLGENIPLIHITTSELEAWKNGDLARIETMLSDAIATSSNWTFHELANRALVRARLEQWDAALEDAKQSLQIRVSPIGHIAMAIALAGQGDRDVALRKFDLSFRDCDPTVTTLLWMLRSIFLFTSGKDDEAVLRVQDLMEGMKDNEAYCFMQVLGSMHLKKGDYARAIESFEHAKRIAPANRICPALTTISLIFNWSFDGLDIAVQHEICEKLYGQGRVNEAAGVLLRMLTNWREEILASKTTADWVKVITNKCVMSLEAMGDAAFKSGQNEDAVALYDIALSLHPVSTVNLLIKRCKARAAMGLWDDALADADEAIKADPSSHLAYESRYIALHGAERFDEAIEAFKKMLSVIEQSDDPKIQELRSHYVSPSQSIAKIEEITRLISKILPLVLIDAETGRLCDAAERWTAFKTERVFKELVSSMATKIEEGRILREVAKFFQYAMFSHVWQGREPTFQQVSKVQSVYDLPESEMNNKLHGFCKEAYRLGHRYVWSDTCCIDKNISTVLNQSLTSMYTWYAGAALTIVYLAGVASPSQLGDLANSIWMTRAWTLQELLSPKCIRFYTSDWKPYLGDERLNHKESPEIMQELADAFKVPRDTIITFSPDDLSVREKLRLASSRKATVEEDVAYSLIGIFKSDIRPHYGEADAALGHLLEEIVARSGEATILQWTGQSSLYHSCLPSSLSVYSRTPYSSPTLAQSATETCITTLRNVLPQADAMSIYHRILHLPPARFANRRLHLPCIAFRVRKLGVQELGTSQGNCYRIKASGLGYVDVTTFDTLPLKEPQRLLFVHLWVSEIRGPRTGIAWDTSDTDSDSEAGSGEEMDDESESSGPLPAVPVSQEDEYIRALKCIVRLGQPFSALLLQQQLSGEYKRVATENEIVVQGLGTDAKMLKSIKAEVLEVL